MRIKKGAETGLPPQSTLSYVANIEGLSHYYGKNTALNDLSIAVPKGQIVGLIGPDGVGKSTLMGLIAGARKVQNGRITVLDGDITRSKHRK